jgi:hypothetical protein
MIQTNRHVIPILANFDSFYSHFHQSITAGYYIILISLGENNMNLNIAAAYSVDYLSVKYAAYRFEFMLFLPDAFCPLYFFLII